MRPIETSNQLQLDFTKLSGMDQDVIPVAVQDIHTKEVLLIAYTNEEALRESLRTRRLVLWSTSRRELWRKGEESGNGFRLLEIRVNCEQNSLVYLVEPVNGGICHTKTAQGEHRRGCYYRTLDLDTQELQFNSGTAG